MLQTHLADICTEFTHFVYSLKKPSLVKYSSILLHSQIWMSIIISISIHVFYITVRGLSECSRTVQSNTHLNNWFHWLVCVPQVGSELSSPCFWLLHPLHACSFIHEGIVSCSEASVLSENPSTVLIFKVISEEEYSTKPSLVSPRTPRQWTQT